MSYHRVGLCGTVLSRSGADYLLGRAAHACMCLPEYRKRDLGKSKLPGIVLLFRSDGGVVTWNQPMVHYKGVPVGTIRLEEDDASLMMRLVMNVESRSSKGDQVDTTTPEKVNIKSRRVALPWVNHLWATQLVVGSLADAVEDLAVRVSTLAMVWRYEKTSRDCCVDGLVAQVNDLRAAVDSIANRVDMVELDLLK